MNEKESKKDILISDFDQKCFSDDYKFLMARLKNIKDSIIALENNFESR